MLRHQFLVLVLAGGVLVLGLLSASTLVRQFFGPSDRNQFLVYVDLPAGYRIGATDDVVRGFSSWLSDPQQNPEITSAIAYVGTGGPRFFLSLSPIDPDPNHGFLVVNTQTGQQVPQVIERIRQRFATGLQYEWTDDVTLGLAYEYVDMGENEVRQSRGPLAGTLQGDYSSMDIHFISLNVSMKF